MTDLLTPDAHRVWCAGLRTCGGLTFATIHNHLLLTY